MILVHGSCFTFALDVWIIAAETEYMTKSPHDTSQHHTGALALWAALRARVRTGAEHRQLDRDLTPVAATLVPVPHSDTAVTREIREMIHA